jgi:hypothetical protein
VIRSARQGVDHVAQTRMGMGFHGYTGGGQLSIQLQLANQHPPNIQKACKKAPLARLASKLAEVLEL